MAACNSSTQTIKSPTPEQVANDTVSISSKYRATPAANEIAAGICGETENEVVQVTIRPDIPDPRCLIVKPEQKLKVVNQAQSAVEVVLGEFKTELAPGQEVLWDVPVGDYLEPGVHLLLVTPCCGPELWLQQ